MARYGRIIHEHKDRGSNTNYMKFETVAIRRDFQQAFLDYHSSHDHDGPVPVYEDITRGDMQSYQLHQAEQRQWPDPRLTIDGYLAHEIYEYHTLTGFQNGTPRYQPPTSCISPWIVLYTDTAGKSGDLVDSGTLERHELSSDFLDMSDDEFKSMLASVEDNGFFDPLVRIHEGQILDGWHRYRAAKELNIVRMLRFTVWDIEKEGTPEDFVIGRNLHRRHLEPGRRAQILVKINNRLQRGDVKSQKDSDPSRDEPKTRDELAKEANVGTATIDRAIQVEETGRAQEVISGKKTAGQVIREENLKTLWEQITPAISAWKAEREGVGYASKTMFIHAALRYEGHPSDTKTTPEVLKALLGMLTDNPDFLEKLIRKQLDGNSLWAEFEDDDPDALDVEAVQRDIIKVREKADTENGGMVSFRPIANKYGISVEEVVEIAKDISGSSLVAPVESPESDGYPLQKWLDEMKSENPSMSDREARKLLKDKKRTCKMMWDKRQEAAAFWMGDSVTELNHYVSLQELEKGFAENNPAYAASYESAMLRTSEHSFNIMLEKVLDSGVDIDVLEREYRALLTYAGDIRLWERVDWSPDTNWILPIIEQNKAKAAAKEEQPESDASLAEQIERNVRAVRDAYTEIYKKGAASVSEMFTAGITYYNLPKEGLELSLENPTGGYEDEKTLTRIEGVTAQMVKDFQGRVRAGWIRKLFPQKETVAPPESAGTDEPDMSALWDAFHKQMPGFKQRYAETDYMHNDLIQASTDEDILAAVRLYTNSEASGPPSVEEIKDATDLLKRRSIPFARRIREVMKAKSSEETTEDTEKAEALEKFANQKAELYKHLDTTPLLQVKDEFGFVNTDKARHGVMVEAYKAYELDDALLWNDTVVEQWTAEDIRGLTVKYFLILQDFSEPRADWVRALYKAAEKEGVYTGEPEISHDALGKIANKLIKEFDAYFETLEIVGEEAYNNLFEKAAVHYSFDLTHFLYITDMQDNAEYKASNAYWESLTPSDRRAWMDILQSMRRDLENRENWAAGIDACIQPPETPETEQDTSLADLNLPATKSFLESLLHHVGQVEHPTTRDDLSVAVLEVFTEQFEGITDRETLSILIDCAHSIVSESESYPRGSFDTLENEVLCPDDEADRQAMNSDL